MMNNREMSDSDNNEPVAVTEFLGLSEDTLPSLQYRPSRAYMPMSPQYVPHRGLVRYSAALKHLIPVRKKNKKRNVLKVDNAGFFSFITYSWMSKYIWQAYKRGLTIDDIPLGSPFDACDLNAQRLEMLWHLELSARGPTDASFGRVIWLFARTRFLLAALTFSLSCLMGFLGPTIFMRKLLEYCEDPEGRLQDGIVWGLALTCSDLLRTLFFCLCWSISYRTATRLRAACLALVYRKIISLHSLGNKSVGEIINLFASDGPRLFYMVVFGPMIIGGPLVTICGIFYIYWILGPWALFGMLTFAFFYPAQYGLSRLTGFFRAKAIKAADKRVKLMSELLNSIKVVKMYAWEKFFTSAITNRRKEELTEMKKAAYCSSLSITMAPMVPAISGIITFTAHVLAGGNLTASQAFPVLTFAMKLLRMSLKHLQESTFAIQDGLVSLPRFKEILLLERNVISIGKPTEASLAVQVEGGTFVVDTPPPLPPGKPTLWQKLRSSGNVSEEQKKLTSVPPTERVELLSEITLSIKKGSLIGVCGSVGSGKSSLLLACLGQLKMSEGTLRRAGSVAYVSQEAWIQNATLKENITFGEAFIAKNYINTVFCCSLNEDIHLLPGGDETVIGERGVNLSGGQKQRVALARAIYANKDIYFMDDPLSAVDSHVSTHIFEHGVLGSLSEKTVILVTHQVAHLQRCDSIIVMKRGHIVAQGSHAELLDSSPDYCLIVQATEFSTVNLSSVAESNTTLDQLTPPSSPLKPMMEKPLKSGNGKQMTMLEEQQKGEVGAYAYSAYLQAAGGYFLSFIAVFAVLINTGTNAFASFWLAEWIKAGGGNTTIIDPVTNNTISSPNIVDNPDLSFYIAIYAGIIGVIIVSSIIRSIVFTKATIRAGKALHENLYNKLIKSPIRYFETTPGGRILNMFARDLDETETRLPSILDTLLQNVWVLAFSFLFISLVFPFFLLLLCVLAVLYYYISKIFRVAVRDLQRLDNITRAPILSCVSATIQGLPTIHAFSKETDFIYQFSKIFDENSTCLFMNCNAMRWMATRLDTISVVITCITAMMVVFLKGQVPAALAGLALTYASYTSGVFQYTIRLLSDAESKFISVERMQNCIQTLVSEGGGPCISPPAGWPARGAIKFKDVVLSYGENLPDVLHSFNLSVRPGEKLGVVGRTGAGKSSLIVALFRLCELNKGSIQIDGVDISTLDLNTLRSAMAVIPQDPVLFTGSFRYNLDPFSRYTDEMLWNVLKKTQLDGKVRSLEGELDAMVGNSGDFLSVGERQLVCLARALLTKSKILLLDEATASVDPETEQAIQATIQTEFSSCTVITIAHRLATVTSTNRVLLMDQGMVVELDEPNVLLANRNSEFSKLAAAMGFIPP